LDAYLLWHVHELPGGEDDAKLIGVYATAEDAEAARQRVADQPGKRKDVPMNVKDFFAVGCDDGKAIFGFISGCVE